jgi:hypothetical protein
MSVESLDASRRAALAEARWTTHAELDALLKELR